MGEDEIEVRSKLCPLSVFVDEAGEEETGMESGCVELTKDEVEGIELRVERRREAFIFVEEEEEARSRSFRCLDESLEDSSFLEESEREDFEEEEEEEEEEELVLDDFVEDLEDLDPREFFDKDVERSWESKVGSKERSVKESEAISRVEDKKLVEADFVRDNSDMFDTEGWDIDEDTNVFCCCCCCCAGWSENNIEGDMVEIVEGSKNGSKSEFPWAKGKWSSGKNDVNGAGEQRWQSEEEQPQYTFSQSSFSIFGSDFGLLSQIEKQ